MGDKCAHYLNCSRNDIVAFFQNNKSFSGQQVICEKAGDWPKCEITGWIHATLAIIAVLCAVITFAKYNRYMLVHNFATPFCTGYECTSFHILVFMDS